MLSAVGNCLTRGVSQAVSSFCVRKCVQGWRLDPQDHAHICWAQRSPHHPLSAKTTGNTGFYYCWLKMNKTEQTSIQFIISCLCKNTHPVRKINLQLLLIDYCIKVAFIVIYYSWTWSRPSFIISLLHLNVLWNLWLNELDLTVSNTSSQSQFSLHILCIFCVNIYWRVRFCCLLMFANCL